MTMGLLTQHRTVMHRVAKTAPKASAKVVRFSNFDADEPDDQTFEEFELPIALWRDMGEPEFITLSVVPGDRLNVGGEKVPTDIDRAITEDVVTHEVQH